jgi:hypothetical protein
MDVYINLGKDLKIKKIGPFKPLAYSQEDLDLAGAALLAAVLGDGATGSEPDKK